MPKSGGTFSGGVSVNGTFITNGAISMKATGYANYDNRTGGCIRNMSPRDSAGSGVYTEGYTTYRE